MIGLDTNVLVRYFAQDDSKQSSLAGKAISALSKESPGFISLIVMCELGWVLEDVYGMDKPGIIGVLRVLLEADELVIESKPTAWAAFQQYQSSPMDFSDALIGGLGRVAGCTHTLTFDKAAAKSGAFELLK
jgi:predicted nucleic-acid-binding protein